MHFLRKFAPHISILVTWGIFEKQKVVPGLRISLIYASCASFDMNYYFYGFVSSINDNLKKCNLWNLVYSFSNF